MDFFGNPLIPKPMVICDDRNNPPNQKETICETIIDMRSREGATILRTLGWSIEEFPPSAFFIVRNSINEKGVVTCALIHTSRKESTGITSVEEQIKESRRAYIELYLKKSSEDLEPLIKDPNWIEKFVDFESFCNAHNIDYKTMKLRKD